jgi:plasmid stabilization system protein ParE
MGLYRENMELKEIAENCQSASFVNECEDEVRRLRTLVEELMDVKSIGPSEREEIKDRIILRLEDELIAVKI